MKWFKHMTDAHDSNDLTKVRARYGAEGYAIYWYCLELIAGELGTSEKITFELRHDAEVIGHNLKIDAAKVEEIMRFMVQLGLFEQTGSLITCLKLAKYLDKKSTRNTKIHEIIDIAVKLSANVPDVSVVVPDKPGPFPLDTDTDTDTDKEKRDGAIAPLKTLSFWDVGESFGIARSTIGRMIREHGEDAVSDALRNLSTRSKTPADATQYVFGILKQKSRDPFAGAI